MERPAVDESYNVDRMKMPWENEMKVSFLARFNMLRFVIPLGRYDHLNSLSTKNLKAAKRARDEAPSHQEYMRKAPVTIMPSQTNHPIRYGHVLRS